MSRYSLNATIIPRAFNLLSRLRPPLRHPRFRLEPVAGVDIWMTGIGAHSSRAWAGQHCRNQARRELVQLHFEYQNKSSRGFPFRAPLSDRCRIEWSFAGTPNRGVE